jgi:FkbM family methyltransferase
MSSTRLLDCALAYVVRYVPSFLGRHRYRYRFYQRVKNSDLTLRGTLKHSHVSLPLNLGDWVQYWMFMDGAYERGLVNFLCPRVKDKVLFDVGANVGSYTLTLAKSARRICSFEASPSNAAILRRFVEQSGLSNIEVVHKAVSDVAGQTINLFTSPDTGGNNSQFYNYGKGSETATTITLDQFAAENKISHVDVIKMDIEGGELRAFRGAERILCEWHPLLLVEFNALVTAPAGWKSSELYDLIRGHGYNAYELRKGKLVRFDDSGMSAPDFYANLIFQHES